MAARSLPVERVGKARLSLECDLERLNVLVADVAKTQPAKATALADKIVEAINRARDVLKEAL